MTAPFTWYLPYAWPRKPVLAGNVVCTSQPLAAQAGLAMLADGGNAVGAMLLCRSIRRKACICRSKR